MTKTKGIFTGIGIFVGLIAIVFILELTGLGFFKFFEPKRENIRREVFENTKSYVQGVQQDLGKYYDEYQRADEQRKQTIKKVIQMRFPEVDASKLQSPQLRQFLTNMRGY